jgi:hypothetical protein
VEKHMEKTYGSAEKHIEEKHMEKTYGKNIFHNW